MREISGLSDHAGQADCQFVNKFKLLREAKAAGNASTASAQYVGQIRKLPHGDVPHMTRMFPLCSVSDVDKAMHSRQASLGSLRLLRRAAEKSKS